MRLVVPQGTQGFAGATHYTHREDVDPHDAARVSSRAGRRDEVAPLAAPAVAHEDGRGARVGRDDGVVGEAGAAQVLGQGLDEVLHHLKGSARAGNIYNRKMARNVQGSREGNVAVCGKI